MAKFDTKGSVRPILANLYCKRCPPMEIPQANQGLGEEGNRTLWHISCVFISPKLRPKGLSISLIIYSI